MKRLGTIVKYSLVAIVLVHVGAFIGYNVKNDQITSSHEAIASQRADNPLSAAKLVELTNSERKKAGIGELQRMRSLDKSALAKCQDMVDKNYWAHDSPSGTSPWYFFEKYAIDYTKAGENLGYGYDDSLSLVNSWMISLTHRNNILDTKYKYVGFGVCHSDNYMNEGYETIVVQHLANI